MSVEEAVAIAAGIVYIICALAKLVKETLPTVSQLLKTKRNNSQKQSEF